jgi:DNA polymerase IV (DinB-like DNA polymerase)
MKSSKARIIIHLDLDYFFAQVEEKRHIDYKDKPLVVCVYTDEEKQKGAVATANYVARKFGVRSGMAVFEAKKLLSEKDALFLPAHYELYEQISNGIFNIVSLYSDKVERASIDEFFLDISERSGFDYEIAEQIAQSIKKEISTTYSLTCSIGIGPNKLIAKIASDFKKPDGLTVVKEEDVQSFLDPLDVDKIPGVGKKTKEILESLGILKIADLRKANSALLVEKFGKLIARLLYRSAQGIDDSEVEQKEEQKQISRITTLKQKSREKDEIMQYADLLIKEIADELKSKDLLWSTVGIIAIDEGMRIHTKMRTLAHPTESAEEIKRIASELFDELIESTTVLFRRVGVKVEKLTSKKGQKTLGEF